MPSSIDARANTANVKYAIYAARVAEVRIVGDKRANDAAIRAKLREQPGAVLNSDWVHADIETLKAAGYLAKAAVAAGPNPALPQDIVLEWHLSAAHGPLSGRAP